MSKGWTNSQPPHEPSVESRWQVPWLPVKVPSRSSRICRLKPLEVSCQRPPLSFWPYTIGQRKPQGQSRAKGGETDWTACGEECVPSRTGGLAAAIATSNASGDTGSVAVTLYNDGQWGQKQCPPKRSRSSSRSSVCPQHIAWPAQGRTSQC